MLVFSSNLRERLGRGDASILQNSSLKRSTEIEAVFFSTFGFDKAFNVSVSIVKPNCPAKRIALTGRSPSSSKRSNGLPTVRIILL